MKKFFLGCLAICLASGCSPSAKEVTSKYPLPQGLDDCVIYDISDGSSCLTVVRCPNSSTSTNYQSGRSTRHVTVVDGAGAEESSVPRPNGRLTVMMPASNKEGRKQQ